MASERLLLVDDDEILRSGLGLVLEASGYEVTIAGGVPEALRLIATRPFEALLTDLHMPPGPEDGFTLIGAVRHAQPQALALLMSADPNAGGAVPGRATRPDEVFRKPVRPTAVAHRIRELLDERAGRRITVGIPDAAEHVALLVEAEQGSIERQWLKELGRAGGREAQATGLTEAERTEHLPEALRDVVFRLRYPQPIGVSTLFSMASLQHGARRRRQGLGAVTLAEEARALQVALFRILEANRDRLAPGELAGAVMAISDQVNAQLLQAIEGYEKENPPDVPYGFQ